jgi:hypothetical protein
MPAQDYLATLLNDLQIRVGRLERPAVLNFSDPAGNTRVEMGLLQNPPSGVVDYGLRLTDANGLKQEILPMVEDSAPGTLSTTSATPVTLAGSAVTAVIGASGDFIVEMCSQIGIAAGGAGSAALTVNGVLHTIIGVVLQGTAATGATLFSSYQYSKITGGSTVTPGSHAFAMQYWSGAGLSAGFSNNMLRITPI